MKTAEEWSLELADREYWMLEHDAALIKKIQTEAYNQAIEDARHALINWPHDSFGAVPIGIVTSLKKELK